jgi:Fe-S cluster biogenesis protein NfuA
MSTEKVTLKDKVEETLDLIRPQLQADGGGVDLVDVNEEGIVSVRLTGACGGCPMSTMTLKMGIERLLLKQVPEVKRVEAV